MFSSATGNFLFLLLVILFVWLIGGFKLLGWLFRKNEEHREGKIAKQVVARDRRTQAQLDAERGNDRYKRLLELIVFITIALIVIFIVLPVFSQ